MGCCNSSKGEPGPGINGLDWVPFARTGAYSALPHWQTLFRYQHPLTEKRELGSLSFCGHILVIVQQIPPDRNKA